MKISIFIPAYNASGHIRNVLDRFPEELKSVLLSVYIINDGSTDSTAEVINELADADNKIIPVHFQKNRGYGSAVLEGMSRCIADSCDYAACVHADEQYPPEAVFPFVSKMVAHSIDIMQGSRIASGTALRGGMPVYKFIAGKILTMLENGVLRHRLTDYHSGFLVYSRKALSDICFNRLSTSFDFDLEVLACARAAGLSVGEMPIPTRYADERSYLNPVTYGLRVLRVLYRYKTGYYTKCIAK